MEKIYVSSNNDHKIEEIKSILEPIGYEVLRKSDLNIADFEVEESEDSLEGNSYLKAEAMKEYTDCAVIADDSGIFADALLGEPGVKSARYAGEECDDEKNNELLLKNLKGKDRTAVFKTVLCYISKDNEVIYASGEVKGIILEERRGSGGFGYDPLFLPDNFDKTYAQMSKEEKNKMSHRKLALENLKEKLLNNKK